VTPATPRATFRRALDAHLRAAVMHDRAAEVFERYGMPEKAARERMKAQAERDARVVAMRRHADWLR
jgi:hypothetical protein